MQNETLYALHIVLYTVVLSFLQRLQEQVNDVIDLHQNAVGELRGQLSQVESATVGKTHDLEDLLLENQSRVGVVSYQACSCIYGFCGPSHNIAGNMMTCFVYLTLGNSFPVLLCT